MRPVIAIVGLPNAGKSTLFNRLTKSRDALVADMPGVTRDRKYGIASHNQHELFIVDTGGIVETRNGTDTISELVSEQTFQAIDEADAIIWLVDANETPTAVYHDLANRFRTCNKSIYLVINKAEGKDSDILTADYFALGLGTPLPVSALHGDGIRELLDTIIAPFPPNTGNEAIPPDNLLRIAVLGKPNVGKSTLINRIIGEERLLTSDMPGTTRDSIHIHYKKNNRDYLLIDTAGVRRRSRVKETIEKFSIIKTIKNIDEADIIILVLDASDGITEQDARLLGMTAESGKSLIITVNKWDCIEPSEKNNLRAQLDRKLGFIDYACIHFISALHGNGVAGIFQSVEKIEDSIRITPTTSELTGLLNQITGAHPPPVIQGRRVKLRYAHLGGHSPLKIIIHGNQTARLTGQYRRYLANAFRKKLELTGTPVIIECRSGENPFKNRRNQPGKQQHRKGRR